MDGKLPVTGLHSHQPKRGLQPLASESFLNSSLLPSPTSQIGQVGMSLRLEAQGSCQMHRHDGNHVQQGGGDAGLLADFTLSQVPPNSCPSLSQPLPLPPGVRESPLGITSGYHFPVLACALCVSCTVSVGFGEHWEKIVKGIFFAVTSLRSDSTPSQVINCAVSWLVRNKTPGPRQLYAG